MIEILLKFIRDKIQELINKLLSKFDGLFEVIDEKITVIHEKAGNVAEKILEKI